MIVGHVSEDTLSKSITRYLTLTETAAALDVDLATLHQALICADIRVGIMVFDVQGIWGRREMSTRLSADPEVTYYPYTVQNQAQPDKIINLDSSRMQKASGYWFLTHLEVMRALRSKRDPVSINCLIPPEPRYIQIGDTNRYVPALLQITSAAPTINEDDLLIDIVDLGDRLGLSQAPSPDNGADNDQQIPVLTKAGTELRNDETPKQPRPKWLTKEALRILDGTAKDLDAEIALRLIGILYYLRFNSHPIDDTSHEVQDTILNKINDNFDKRAPTRGTRDALLSAAYLSKIPEHSRQTQPSRPNIENKAVKG